MNNYILNIETATKNCSVSLARDGETIICKEISELGYSHAEMLHVFIEDIIKESNITFQDLKAIAVSRGPGSYTGLRIGISTAKGFCYALDIPLIALDTLTILAHQLDIDDGKIIPMVDARRMEVYSAIYDENKQLLRDTEAQILQENSFEFDNEKIYFIGDSNEKAKTVLKNDNYIFCEDIIYPSAKQMSNLSYEKFLNYKFEDLAYFEPFYLKDYRI